MNVRVNLDSPIYDGREVVFKAPCDASEVTGLIVYYPSDAGEVSSVFTFADAHANDLGHIDELFAAGAVVKVILDTDTGMAFVQNAATNAYLENKFKNMGGGGGTLMLEAQEENDGTISWVDVFNWDEIATAVQAQRQVIVRLSDVNDAYTYYLLTTAELEDSRLVFSRPIDAYMSESLWVTRSGYATHHTHMLGGGGSVDLSNYYTKAESDSVYASKSYVYTEASRIAISAVRREVDTTLSVSSKPADAKAVGDAIGNISSALTELHNYAEALKGGGSV